MQSLMQQYDSQRSRTTIIKNEIVSFTLLGNVIASREKSFGIDTARYGMFLQRLCKARFCGENPVVEKNG